MQAANKIPSLKNSGGIANIKAEWHFALWWKIETDFPGLSDADKKRHIIDIPHLGTISFAEVLSLEGMKTLTMLRFDLGSPDGGGGTAAVASTNGKLLPHGLEALL
jgi:hypothetical protein